MHRFYCAHTVRSCSHVVVPASACQNSAKPKRMLGWRSALEIGNADNGCGWVDVWGESERCLCGGCGCGMMSSKYPIKLLGRSNWAGARGGRGAGAAGQGPGTTHLPGAERDARPRWRPKGPLPRVLPGAAGRAAAPAQAASSEPPSTWKCMVWSCGQINSASVPTADVVCVWWNPATRAAQPGEQLARQRTDAAPHPSTARLAWIHSMDSQQLARLLLAAGRGGRGGVGARARPGGCRGRRRSEPQCRACCWPCCQRSRGQRSPLAPGSTAHPRACRTP